jgi:saccharopine dehydrogenase (NAD+, L-lysine-forming)
MKRWMLYGANGYTGRLIASLAVARGERPILAGRSADAVRALAAELGLEARVFGLEDAAFVRQDLEGIAAVLHAAGPFSATSKPMVDACLAAGAHYLDITGEVSVFEAVFARDAEARQAEVALLPGVGFDVVPTDCLAAMLAERLPGATHLELGFGGLGSTSQGTAKTIVENLHRGGLARIDGKLTPVPTAWKTRELPLPHGARLGVSIPWGDVSTAYRSTGIPNICVYLAVPRRQVRAMRVLGAVRWALRPRPVQAALKKIVEWRVRGPSPELRAQGYSDVWGEVRRGDEVVSLTLTAPEGYTLTADAALRAVQTVMSGSVPPGAWTPSRAFGASFVRELEGVRCGGEEW